MLDLFPGSSFLGAKNRMQSSAAGSLTGADHGADNLHQGSRKTESTTGSPYNSFQNKSTNIAALTIHLKRTFFNGNNKISWFILNILKLVLFFAPHACGFLPFI